MARKVGSPADIPGCRITRAIIDLDAIAANVRALRREAQSTHLMAVVKANAYGHGATAVAATAVRHGATWLGVYTVEEGIALREAGLSQSILVFGPFGEREASQLIDGGLTPTLTSFESAAALQHASKGATISVHVKVDTGLNRAGIEQADALRFFRGLRDFPALIPDGLFTHFASANEEEREPTLWQFRTFTQIITALRRDGFPLPLVHAANTAGILDFPDTHADMVRTGIGMYGYRPSSSVPGRLDLVPALSLVSRLTRVHAVAPGDGVGYGGTFRPREEALIGLVPVGYGDGLPRSIGNGRGSILVRGQAAPIVGRVSMDQLTVDVTQIPGAKVGDDAVLIGTQGTATQTAEDVARHADTISYDVLTGIMPRVPRIYVEGARVVGTMTLASGDRFTPLDAGQHPDP